MAEWYDNLTDSVPVKVISAGKENKSIKDKTINFLTGFANAVSQGVTFGTADEIAGFFAPVFGGDREAVRDAMRDNLEQFREDSPFTAYGTEIAASIAASEGYGTNYEQDNTLVNFLKNEISK